MDITTFLFLLLQSLIQYPQMAGDGLDEATRLRMELRAKHLTQEMTRLLQELEQGPLEGSVSAGGTLPWAALQHWHLWALAGVLVLLLGRWFSRRRRSHEADNNDEEEEDTECNNDAFEVEGDGEVNDHKELEDCVFQYFKWLVEWDQPPDEDLRRGCKRTTVLMKSFIFVFKRHLLNTSYPLPQKAIGVSSAFEGWSFHKTDIVYYVLVPLIPPPGHTFHLELDTAGHIPGRNFRIRVEQVCTCTREKQGENVQCLIRGSEPEMMGHEDPSDICTLCTDSCLDVKKTAHWFYQLVSICWGALPESHNWHLNMLPSSCSCKLMLTRGTQRFTVEMLFGVQQGDSDIFVISHHTEAYFIPSTVWPETYSVAEVKFFRHIASQAPRDSWHLKCLQFLARFLLGTAFFPYTVKTIVMHLLNTVPESQWDSRQFTESLKDTLQYLRCSVLQKRLDHFILGNRRLPELIRLPPDVQNSDPPNLFHHLARDEATYDQALRDCNERIDLIRKLVYFDD